AAIRARAGESEARRELAARMRDRPPALARELLRAFSTWFMAVNLAERVHRIRRRRQYLRGSEEPQPGGVEAAIAELKARRLTVADEREQILFYLVEILYRMVPAFYEEIAQALEKVYGAKAGTVHVPAILRFGSWAGGDMDGNPDVHAKSIREALARQQQVIL